MSLISCPDCQNQISNKARSCPHCGRPFVSIKIPLILFLILGIFIFILGAASYEKMNYIMEIMYRNNEIMGKANEYFDLLFTLIYFFPGITIFTISLILLIGLSHKIPGNNSK